MDISPELREKAKACTSPEQLLALNKFRSCQREEPAQWCECFLHVDVDGNAIPPVTPDAKMDMDVW